MIGNVVKNPSGNINLGPITANGNYNFDVGRYKTASVAVTVEQPHIYGVTWSGGSSPVLTRTDDAAGFIDPNPYYAGMATTPSSPFDGLMPWAGIRRVTDATAGELVEIPKFWYKWTRSGNAMQLQIADKAKAGFFVSPAHADRGDGVGERDYVYVGRYHCASDYKSKTGVSPTRGASRSSYRTSIHNLGSNVWQWDYAMYWTVAMLYLVEFAHWNSQLKIGYGGSTSASFTTEGQTDNIPYHTGTTTSSRSSYGYTEYRYIEGLWSNVFDFIDGLYFSGSTIYAIKNPANFSDSSGGTNVGTRVTSSGYIKSWTTVNASGFEYAIFPKTVDDTLSGSTYCCDLAQYQSGGTVLLHGGYIAQNLNIGLFCLFHNISSGDQNVGTRLMVLPPSRLSV